MSSLIAVLFSQDWIPSFCELWSSPQGEQYAMTSHADVKPFLDEFVNMAEAKLWERASKHHLGNGLREGIDSDLSFALLRTWRARKHDGQDWPPQRLINLLE